MSNPWRWFSLRRPGALIALTISVAVLLLLTVNAWIGRGPLQEADVRVARTLNEMVRESRAEVTFWRFVTRAGSPVVWDVVAGIVVISLLVLRRRRLAALGVVSLAGAAVLSTVVKTVVGRPRPQVLVAVDHAAGMSFPSGHAMTSLVAVAFLLLVGRSITPQYVRPAVVAVAATVVVVIGLSRLVLGVHYVTDVLAGWLAGGLWFLVCVLVLGGDGGLAVRPAVRIGSDATTHAR